MLESLCQGVAPTAPSSSSSPSQTSSSRPKHSNYAGAIAGGVVGGVVGLAAVAALLFFLLRSHKREKTANTERDAAIAKANTQSPSTGTERTDTSELGNKNRTELVDDWVTQQRQQEPVEVRVASRKGAESWT